MKVKIIRCSILALCAAALTAECAGEVKWNGKSGKWSDASIWDGGVIPDSTDLVSFPNGRKLTGTVEIDGDYCVSSLYLKQQDWSGEYPITFTGSGSISIGSQLFVNQKRKLVVKGPSIIANSVSVGNRIEINHGSVSCVEFKANNDGMTISVVDGSIVANTLELEKDNCSLVATNSDICIGTIAGTPVYSLSGGSFAVTNGGLKLASGVKEAHFDVDEFALAGYFGASDLDTKVVFDRPVTIGAYADWSTDSADENELTSVEFAGSVVFNTTDLADLETGRTITIKGLSLDSMYDSISVVGSGTAHLRPATSPFRLKNISVGEGSTLQIKYNTYSTVYAQNMSMETGSRIFCRPDKVSLEFESTSISPDAVVELDMSDASEPRLQVWTDFSNGDKPRFVCSGSEAYSVRTAGPFAFVSNGTIESMDKDTMWTGLGSDAYWRTVENWKASVPDASGEVAYFRGDVNTEITNDAPRTVARMYFSDTGAYAFFGEPIGLNSAVTNDNNSPLRNASSLPVAVYNTLTKTSNKATGLSFVSYGRSFIALMGEVALTNFIFRFSGDMRVGGNVNCSSVIFDPNLTTKQTSCTILPGAELVATAQSEVQTKGIGYDVRTGGVLDVRGGVWGWTMPVTNLIDGTLKLNAAFGGTSILYFGGRGNIILGGSAHAESGSVVTIVGSNTVTATSGVSLGKWSVAPGATLTLDSAGSTFTFTDTVEGEGRLVFVPGTKAALGGELLAASRTAEGAVISTAAETIGSLVWPDNHCVYLDGGIYRVKRRPGLSVSIR